jgi:flagellar biosynthetic protein FliQ
MSSAAAVDLFRQALLTAFWIAFPLLAIGFVVGMIISIVQVITSMQDASFSTVPRLTVFLLGTLVLLPWMLSRMTTYTLALFGDLARYAR